MSMRMIVRINNVRVWEWNRGSNFSLCKGQQEKEGETERTKNLEE